MTGKIVYIIAAIVALDGALLLAQEKPAEGTLTLVKKTYQLSQGVGYEGTVNGEDATVVLLSNQPISAQKLKAGRAAEKESSFFDFKQPILRLVFKKNGELSQWNGFDTNTSVSGVPGEGAKAELKLENGRAIGKASHPLDPSQMIPRTLDVKFNVAMLKAGEELPAAVATKSRGPAVNVKPSVTGTFKGNGKDGKLAFVSARWTEPFDNKPGILLLFTEKDHAKGRKPETDAMFGKFGNALIISSHDDGGIYSCQVVHSALKNKGFSSSGSIEINNFTYEAGKVEGELTTNGPVDAFGDTWEVKLNFLAPLGEVPKEYQVPESTKADKATVEPAESKQEETAKPAAPKLNVKDLALTKDASDFEYKALVEQMSFKSKLPVKSVCAELAKSLKAQGWTTNDSDLITAKSSILKRKRGQAELTIFVKPADGGGSTVSIMSEGLSWDGQ
jgi:hypothetical protein